MRKLSHASWEDGCNRDALRPEGKTGVLSLAEVLLVQCYEEIIYCTSFCCRGGDAVVGVYDSSDWITWFGKK
jgi:hypothetical protein